MPKFLKLFFLIALVIPVSLCQGQWKRQAKSGNSGLSDVVFLSKASGFVLGSGKVLKTTDTGKTWTQILSGYDRFTGIVFADAANGFITGYDDLVLKTSDAGDNWSLKRTGNSDDDLLKVFAIDKDTLFVIGPDNLDKNDSINYLGYTYNGGVNWVRQNLNSTRPVASIVMLDKSRGYIANQNGSVFQTLNGFSGYSQSYPVSHLISDLKVIKDSIIILAGNGGKISRSSNYGKTYKSISTPTTENLKSLHFTNDSVGMVCGENGTIMVTGDCGKSWTKMTTGTRLDFSKIYVVNPYLAWAVAYSTSGDSSDIFKYEDKTCESRFINVPRDTVICDKYDYETRFSVRGKNKPVWTVNDALTNLSRTNDTIAKIYTVHEGKFIISFELQNCEETIYDTTTVFFWRNPTIDVKDSLYCGAVNDLISFSCFSCKYLWSNNDDSYNFAATQPGKYWVRASNLCKTISDTFTLSYLPFLKLDLGNDTLICAGEKLILKNNLSPGKNYWHNGDTSSGVIITNPGKYYVDFENKCNKLSDTILVKYKKPPTFSFGNDTSYCGPVNHQVTLDSVKNFSTVLWNDGNSAYNRNLTIPGMYELTISNECGTVTDMLKLSSIQIPLADAGRDTIYCQNFKHTVKLDSKTTEFIIEWFDGDTSGIKEFNLPGVYPVRVYNKCGENSDTLKIFQNSVPKVDLGKDTALKKPFTLILDAENPGSRYLWNTGDTGRKLVINDFGNYRVIVSNYCGTDIDTFSVFDKAGFKAISVNTPYRLYPNPSSSDEVFVYYKGGKFDVELTNSAGCKVLEKADGLDYIKLDTSLLSPGIYFAWILINKRSIGVIKLIKI